MSTLILSLLLLFLVAVGLMMGAKVAERFENPESTTTTITVSPALKNMMVTSSQPQPASEQTELSREQDLQNARNSLGPGGQRKLIGPDGEEHWVPNFGPDGPENWPYPTPKPAPTPNPKPPAPHPMPPPKPQPKPEPTPMPPAPTPPGCPVCPDMSQYIRLDEVPCWNCTLP